MSKSEPGVHARKGKRAVAVVLRVLLGFIALQAAVFGCSAGFWAEGRDLAVWWVGCAGIAIVCGWLAGRGLPLTRPDENDRRWDRNNPPSGPDL